MEPLNKLKGSMFKKAIILFSASAILFALGTCAYYALEAQKLLPDIVPLPPRDLSLRSEGGRILLYFSTTYYNQGEGPVELRFDSEALGVPVDIERKVMQRIYLENQGFVERSAGTFLWHDQHLHYHFDDFVRYTLERIEDDSSIVLDTIKSTFCLRDVSRALINLPDRSESGEYKTCDSQIQGSSVGWGETYYFDYPGQQIDMTGLSSGTYRLTTTINPDRYIKEGKYDNNIAWTLFLVDAEKGTATFIEEFPPDAPAVEHVRLESPFGGVSR
jgi:hypothetical protein